MWRAHYLNERGEWKVLPRGKIIATLGWGMGQLGGMSFKIARENEETEPPAKRPCLDPSPFISGQNYTRVLCTDDRFFVRLTSDQ
ncbi:protein ORF51 [Goose adenovirus 4]|uniref:Protein ORF51 n=1 Tax=Goose adenovirus 4 TaxID=1193422 RepID=I3RU93_9ADEN|nr:protein ORF51 [Goose adenovirus 4]AFK30951.1 protein ORF51 [Goose adenovirus 4]